ncbi:MAG TPA: CHAT domain-containing protein [Synechococcales cyanobacterium M55_K2018_004]|nr:CHAT domain-containing protein [Synechococcales cyanobacterium M55_K2018_004]
MSPCFRVAIARLTSADPDHYAIWVVQAPHQAGHVHHDCLWTQDLTDAWELWQSLFSLRRLPEVPRIPSVFLPPAPSNGGSPSYTSRAMQHLGVSLYQWAFSGPIQNSFAQSQGIAFGQGKPLRLRLEIRDPELIALPWEIMQPQPGMQTLSLSQQVLFSRTTSEVAPLPELRSDQSLRILLVLGQDADVGSAGSEQAKLQLQQEAEALPQLLEQSAAIAPMNSFVAPVPCEVKTLVQPSAADLIEHLETRRYNVLFYSGHGMPGADGGLLFLRPDATINGTELAQVLTRCQVKLAVFNACWGAQPERQGEEAIPRSSLAEVLIHHGVPAVLGMRDSIADHEALQFIQVFAKALAERSPIDEAVAIARQNLLTLYGFNQSTWSLPVLYMHPEFDGELVRPLTEGVTEIPDHSGSWIRPNTPPAVLRSLTPPVQTWRIDYGVMRVGNMEGNDLILRGPGISRRHAEIFYRDAAAAEGEPAYYLRDFSRYGSYYLNDNQWCLVHQREVPLRSPTRLRFGNFQLEFVVDNLPNVNSG